MILKIDKKSFLKGRNRLKLTPKQTWDLFSARQKRTRNQSITTNECLRYLLLTSFTRKITKLKTIHVNFRSIMSKFHKEITNL